MFEYSPGRSTIIIGAAAIFGIIGGTYLLTKTQFYSQLTDRRAKKKKPEPCNVCFTELDVDDIKICVPCCSCEKSICRGKNCSYWLPKSARWECQLCNLSKASQCRTTEWINKQTLAENEIYHPMKARSELNIPIIDDRMSMTGSLNYLPGYSPAPSTYGMNLDREKIRNHVEDVLAEMLGGSLDNISVGPMSRNTQYLPLWESNSSNNLDNINPTNISHIKLKRLIERIIDETLRIPQLTDFSGVPQHLTSSDNLLQPHYERRHKNRNSNRKYNNKISKSNDDFGYDMIEGNNPQYFDPKRYQELLATAVLNKIVDTCATERRSVSESSIKCIDNNQNKIPITTELCTESSSSSSHDPRSDSSLTDPVQDINHNNLASHLYANVLNENFDLESAISESRASFRNIQSDNDSFEDYASVASGADSTWEENWLFKKRKLLTHPTAPIGMLVPAPKEDIKAMIGDKSADEISDFSENEESDETNANNNDSGPENYRMQNKVVIGGQNVVGLFDDLMEQTSFISQTSSVTDNVVPYIETKNDYVDYKYGLNVTENSNLDLNCTGITLKTEAVNTVIGVNIGKNDDEINEQKTENNDNAECMNPIKSEINPQERTSSDSTITDESTHTILDANEEAQIAKENYNQHLTKVYVNGNSEQEVILCDESSDIDNVVHESKQVTNNMEDSDRNLLDNKISTLTINISSNNLTTSDKITDLNNNINTNTVTKIDNSKILDDGTNIPNEQFNKPNPEKNTSLELTNINTIPKLIDTKKTEAFCGTLDMSDEDDQNVSLIPGSIAEREHKKWYNAVEMPNNPYAPEALLRRLDTGPQKPLDIPDKRVSTPITTPEEEKITEAELSAKNVDLSIYSRDYYVPSPTSNTTKSKLIKMQVIDRDSLEDKSLEETTLITKENQSKQQYGMIEELEQNNNMTRTPPNTPITPTTTPLPTPKTRPNELKLSSASSQSPCKTGKTAMALTPQTFKFLHPKRKIIEPSQIMTQEQYSTPPETPDKPVIEEDVVNSLPSVKALARAFLLTSGATTILDDISTMSLTEPNNNEIKIECRKKSPLEESSSVPVQEPSVKQIYDGNQNNLKNFERPISPVLKPGKLKDNIAFFENLKKH